MKVQKLGKRLKKEEIEYIRTHVLSESDEQIGKALGRKPRTITKARKKLGIIKGGAGRLLVSGKPNQNYRQGEIGQRLTEDQRKEFFKTELCNSVYYQNLVKQFTKEEIDFYLEEHASLSIQFLDVLATEKRQIDEYIKAQILGNRILKNVQILEDEITRIQNETQLLYKNHDMSNDEKAQERDEQLRQITQLMSAQCNGMTHSYQDNVDTKNKLLDHLNARRRDRITDLKKSGTTFLGLVTAFREKEVRDTQGRYMELMRLAKDKKKTEFRKEITFPDGSKDCILMDEHSELIEPEFVLISDAKCKFIEKYQMMNNCSILIVENENRRVQFFQTIFANQRLDFANNVTYAMELLAKKKFSLICLDYDLSIDGPGEIIAKYIIDNGIEGDILVHSMNEAGAEKIRTILVNRDGVEIFPFESIVKGTDFENKIITKLDEGDQDGTESN